MPEAADVEELRACNRERGCLGMLRLLRAGSLAGELKQRRSFWSSVTCSVFQVR